MRLEKYTYDVRNFGQAVYGAHKVDANERTSNQPMKMLDIFIESVSEKGEAELRRMNEQNPKL